MRERNYQTCRLLLLTDVIHYLVNLSPTGEHTCFAGTATVNRSPHRHSSRCWLEAPAGSSTEKLAEAIGRRHWPICWCCLDRGPGSFDVEDATTLSWSSTAVSEWVSLYSILLSVLLCFMCEIKYIYNVITVYYFTEKQCNRVILGVHTHLMDI